jgi:hypothetical protein
MNHLNQKRVLVNGCSFSRGPGSWPYQLSNNHNLVNLACAGAGNRYIHNSTVSELAQRSYDLVLVMWSGIDRLDWQVEDIELFHQSKNTSKYQSLQNDWPSKTIYPVNDQDYVEKNWVFGCGFVSRDSVIKKTGLFEKVYRYTSHKENISQTVLYIISLQSILKQMNLPYVFMFYHDYLDELKQDLKYHLIDKSNLFVEDNIWNMAVRGQMFAEDNQHPAVEIHKHWANLLDQHLLEKYHCE